MIPLARIAQTEAVLFLACLAVAVAFQLLTGRINMHGLLDDKTTGELDPARVQLLVLTLVVAGQLILDIPDMRDRGGLALHSGALLAVLGGSHGVYLIQKARQSFGRAPATRETESRRAEATPESRREE